MIGDNIRSPYAELMILNPARIRKIVDFTQ